MDTHRRAGLSQMHFYKVISKNVDVYLDPSQRGWGLFSFVPILVIVLVVLLALQHIFIDGSLTPKGGVGNVCLQK